MTSKNGPRYTMAFVGLQDTTRIDMDIIRASSLPTLMMFMTYRKPDKDG
jgi:hypothetical protein